MKRGWLIAGAALALSSSLALAGPQSLLPGMYSDPEPEPQPTRTPDRPAAAQPSAAGRPAAEGSSTPGVQQIPGAAGPLALPENFPSIEELEEMTPEEFDELLGVKAKFDIPPSARRDAREIGILSQAEGGMRLHSLSAQPASLVRAAIEGTRFPLVSRWGHILLRRTLASRLSAPRGIKPVDFAAMRARLLLRLGEGNAARALVQDVDSANYNSALTDVAFSAYLATGDLVGMCPVARLHPTMRNDAEWQMTRSICAAFGGEEGRSSRELDRAFSQGIAPRIDVQLAQRFGGAGGIGRRTVDIDWEGVDSLTPWRYSLATALGVEIPAELLEAGHYERFSAVSPAVPLAVRVDAADIAARAGVLSSAAIVDLYGQVYVEQGLTGPQAERAADLREAYLGRSPEDRLAAIKALWGSDVDYGRQVLTAYAAARIPPGERFSTDAPQLIASMLTAGLDRNALRWAPYVKDGTLGWALLAVARPAGTATDTGALDQFINDDSSDEQRKSRFLVAGLAGLGRISGDDANGYAKQLGIALGRASPWSRMIDKAAQANNSTLVALLVGLGMQGSGWDKMTARHLYHIVRALNRVGLTAEARMIAVEAVARA